MNLLGVDGVIKALHKNGALGAQPFRGTKFVECIFIVREVNVGHCGASHIGPMLFHKG